MKQKVGFIGLGIMGGAMARNLHRAGFPLRVFNRTPGKAGDLAALEARSAAELARSSEIVCLSVTNGRALEEILFGAAGAAGAAAPGTLFIDFSTTAPADSRRIAARLTDAGLRFLDAPVSGGDVGARNATLTIMVGGREEDVAYAMGALEAVGKTIVHMGPHGAGQMTKAVNQVLVALSVAAMTEGLVLAKAFGLDLERTLQAVGAGAAGSWSLQNYAPRVLRGELGPGFYARDMLKDLRIASAEAAERNVSLPATSLVQGLYTEFCAGEGRDLGNHALIRLYEQRDKTARG